jgi:hypothetical protein
LGSGARLKATDARNLPRPVKVALRTREKVVHTQDELQRWIKNLNQRLHTENWRILNKQSGPKGQRIILHIDRDPFLAIKKTGYKIVTGLSQGTVKVLKDPEAQHQKEGAAANTASSESGSVRGREMEHPLPHLTREEQRMQKRKLLQTSNLLQQISGSFRREPGLTRRKKQRRRGWRQSPPLVNKE